MEHDNIKLIQDTAVAAADSLAGRVVDKTNHPVVAMPEGYTLHNLEPFNQFKNRFTGTFETHLVKDFYAYYEANAGPARSAEDRPRPPCFIDPDNIMAQVIFDLGGVDYPEHCRHNAVLTLKDTPAFRAVAAIASSINGSEAGMLMSQQELFNFLQDWGQHIAGVGHDGEGVDVKHAAQDILTLEITLQTKQGKTVGNMNESSSSFEKLEAAAKAGKKLPSGFVFSCQPYHGLSIRDWYLDLSVVFARNDEPKLKLRCVGFDVVMEEIRDEFKDKVVEAFLDEEASVLIGKFSA